MSTLGRRSTTMQRERQLTLPFPNGWGGARRNAGRKPGVRPNVPHHARPVHRRWEPVLVTLRSRIAPLRSQFVFPSVRLALSRAARRDPERFRIVHFSVQRDHVHLVVEAAGTRELSAGMRSVAIRVARYVNDLLSRRGSVWADRWHGRALRSPREVRNAIVYVLGNFRKHARRPPRVGIDPYSSAPWFGGFREWNPASGVPPPLAVARAIAPCELGEVAAFAPRTWLAARGWRRVGLIGIADRPSPVER